MNASDSFYADIRKNKFVHPMSRFANINELNVDVWLCNSAKN